MRRAFLDVASEIGIDEKTVRNLFVEHSLELEKSVRFETPRWMGIDEVFYRGRYLIVITNLEHRTVVNLLSAKSAAALTDYFLGLPDPGGVELVSMDMEGMYANKVHEILPRAIVVIDKFHIMQRMMHTMNRLINDLREDIPKKQSRALRRDRFGLLLNTSKRERDMTQYLRTETWMDEFPVLRCGWELLQRFYAMWELPDETQARKYYAAWRASVPGEFEARLKLILDVFDKRPDDIFSYFNTPITNAYTESANAKIKQIQRLGHGYDFPALRAKVLYSSVYRVCPRYQRPLPETEFQRVLRKKDDSAHTPAQSAHQPLLPLAEPPPARVSEDVKGRDADLQEMGADTDYVNYGAPFERGRKIA
jgi:transposase